MSVRDSVRRRLLVRHGEAVVDPWWRTLPRRIDELAERWDLRTLAPIDGGTTSVVLRTDRGIVVIDPRPCVGDPAWNLEALSRVCTGEVEDLVRATRATAEDVRAWARVFGAGA